MKESVEELAVLEKEALERLEVVENKVLESKLTLRQLEREESKLQLTLNRISHKKHEIRLKSRCDCEICIGEIVL
jgi:hypothetical protein